MKRKCCKELPWICRNLQLNFGPFQAKKIVPKSTKGKILVISILFSDRMRKIFVQEDFDDRSFSYNSKRNPKYPMDDPWSDPSFYPNYQPVQPHRASMVTTRRSRTPSPVKRGRLPTSASSSALKPSLAPNRY